MVEVEAHWEVQENLAGSAIVIGLSTALRKLRKFKQKSMVDTFDDLIFEKWLSSVSRIPFARASGFVQMGSGKWISGK